MHDLMCSNRRVLNIKFDGSDDTVWFFGMSVTRRQNEFLAIIVNPMAGCKGVRVFVFVSKVVEVWLIAAWD